MCELLSKFPSRQPTPLSPNTAADEKEGSTICRCERRELSAGAEDKHVYGESLFITAPVDWSVRLSTFVRPNVVNSNYVTDATHSPLSHFPVDDVRACRRAESGEVVDERPTVGRPHDY